MATCSLRAAADLQEDEWEEEAPVTVGRRPSGSVRKGKTSEKLSTSLADLVVHAILVPGRDKLTCTYKGTMYVASLCEDGSIDFEGEPAAWPSALSADRRRHFVGSHRARLHTAQPSTWRPTGCAGRRYHSPTAWSIYVKRLITPDKQGDDGWKSVLYDGRALEHFRRALCARATEFLAAPLPCSRPPRCCRDSH